ncbi:unnamed protein product [Fusarium venenatum]|uniref:Uncharacterized protein n=1 Tax=Fusarium venenatum TaxID=56646 RepID=A0A2L2TKA7_9HYPO|nr:uncharacterized protein FVRRES_08580 [Fusarium venenatum]CEI68503.1 unnamed protein product [Fusarium venenatum]
MLAPHAVIDNEGSAATTNDPALIQAKPVMVSHAYPLQKVSFTTSSLGNLTYDENEKPEELSSDVFVTFSFFWAADTGNTVFGGGC